MSVVYAVLVFAFFRQLEKFRAAPLHLRRLVDRGLRLPLPRLHPRLWRADDFVRFVAAAVWAGGAAVVVPHGVGQVVAACVAVAITGDLRMWGVAQVPLPRRDYYNTN